MDVFFCDMFFFCRYYLPFAESALRYFFALGFVPWRLRKLSTGDLAPEVIPLGLFTWSIDSMPNRVGRARRAGRDGLNSARAGGAAAAGASAGVGKFTTNRTGARSEAGMDKYQMAAEKAFQKQKAYFSDPKRVPYPLQGDVMRMGNRSDETKRAEKERLKGFAEEHRKQVYGDADGGKQPAGFGLSSSKDPMSHIPAFHRQKEALSRQPNAPPDDDDTKMLRYGISFTENCNVLEEDVEIYEYLAPTNSITRYSLLYGTVPSPLSHILIDYRNIRTALIRQAYADSYNTQAKLICSYDAPRFVFFCSSVVDSKRVVKRTVSAWDVGDAYLTPTHVVFDLQEHVQHIRGGPHPERRGLGTAAAAGTAHGHQPAQ